MTFPYTLITLVFLSMLPVTMIVPVVKDIIKDRLLGSNWEVAYFTSIPMLGSFLFAPVAGMISDRFRNRKYFIAAFCFVDAFLFYLLTQIHDMNLFLLVRFFEGASHIFIIGLLLSSAADRENDPENTRYYGKGILMGITGMFLSLGGAFGMPLGILGRKNPLLPFYVGSGILVFVGLVALFKLKDTGVHKQKEFKLSHLKTAIIDNPYLYVPFLFNFIDRFTVGFIISSFNIHLRETLAFHPGILGVFLGLVLFPMSLLSYPSALISRKTGVLPLVLAGSLIYGIFLGLSGTTDNFWLLFTYLLICGIGAGVMFVPSMMLASKMSRSGLTATTMSAFTGIGSLGFMLGPVVSVQMEGVFKANLPAEYSFPALSFFFGFLEIGLVLLTIPFFKKILKKIKIAEKERHEIPLANSTPLV
ncbi:MFS transporter [Leptospira ilyithenensis]|uniref:MFS transporter n=1 Tax=Leptospira ilyithenensis TaxID=2484901 RepID=A0A4R9LM57_9LEPT|nr:MFS transporter [Leptospira ilyithenensis]TGN09409.1 MFS transporter [Leptospira ilyithenensis]